MWWSGSGHAVLAFTYSFIVFYFRAPVNTETLSVFNKDTLWDLVVKTSCKKHFSSSVFHNVSHRNTIFIQLYFSVTILISYSFFSEKVLMKLSELNWLIVWTTATFTLESAAQIQIWETMDWKLLSRGERRWVEARKVAHKVTSSGLSRTIWPERNHGPATSSYWNTSSTGRDFIYTHIRPIINWLIR